MNESNLSIISGFLDESSSLSQSEQYFIVALVTVKDPFSPVWPQIFKRTRRRLGKRQRQIGEFKFYKSDEQIKRSILQQLARRDEIDISVTVVDKAGRRVPDTPEHYGMVVGQTVVDFLSRFGQLGLTIDKRYTNDRLAGRYIETVKRIIFTLPRAVVSLIALESERSPLLQLVDFVAGAFNRKYNGGDSGLVDLIAGRVISEQVYQWRVIKERWREK